MEEEDFNLGDMSEKALTKSLIAYWEKRFPKSTPWYQKAWTKFAENISSSFPWNFWQKIYPNEMDVDLKAPTKPISSATPTTAKPTTVGVEEYKQEALSLAKELREQGESDDKIVEILRDLKKKYNLK